MADCPTCGQPTSGKRISDIVADGYEVGCKGGACDVPPAWVKDSVNSGLWRHGWRLGAAVKEQVAGA